MPPAKLPTGNQPRVGYVQKREYVSLRSVSLKGLIQQSSQHPQKSTDTESTLSLIKLRPGTDARNYDQDSDRKIFLASDTLQVEVHCRFSVIRWIHDSLGDSASQTPASVGVSIAS